MAKDNDRHSDDDSKRGGFKVVDRRRFDDQGNEKPEVSVDPSGNTASTLGKSSGAPDVAASSAGASGSDSFVVTNPPEPEINFSSFVVSLATQALMQLGEIPPPPGMEVPEDHESSKQTIDILTMIREKTRGNLDPNEDQLIEEILHSLRIAYVRRG